VKLQIWDTAGQEKYQSVTINFFKQSHGAVIAFDLSNPQSWESVG